MDIKLKKLLRNKIVKLVAFILASLCIILGIYSALKLDDETLRMHDNSEFTYSYGYNADYSEIDYARLVLDQQLYNAETIAKLESEEAIRENGKYIVKGSTNEYGGNPVVAQEELNIAYYYGYESYSNFAVTESDDNSYLGFYSQLTGSWAESESTLKSMHIALFNDALESLESSGVDYEIITGSKIYKKGNNDSPYSVNIKDLVVKWSIPTEKNSSNRRYDAANFTSIDDPKTSVYLGTNAENFAKFQEAEQKALQLKTRFFLQFNLLFLVGLLSLIVLTAGAGRSNTDNGKAIHLNWWDKPYLELSLGLICIVSSIVVAWVDHGVNWFTVASSRNNIIAGFTVAFFPFILLLGWWISFVKRFKLGKWWQHTLIYTFFAKIGSYIQNLWAGAKRGQEAFGKVQWIIIIVLMLLTLSPFVGFITVPLAFICLLLFNQNFVKLKKGIDAVEKGDYNNTIDIDKGIFVDTARSVENISANMNTAVFNQIKSERLKTELITNVSHDLRTPLTSIITYADLLKSKGLQGDDAPEHLDILIQKANRLKVLTDDLFEATKASSGNISTNLKGLDFTQLVNQCLGELETEKEQSNLDFHINMPKKAMIIADGRLMHRILENLFSNILKYSLAGSRVYIDLNEKNDAYQLDCKNISAYPLNISPDELTQRFSRGDVARATEGSGLGLSIVESFVLNQNGTFNLSIDGDLFKAQIALPKA